MWIERNYNLKFIAKDSNNNYSEKDFTLVVKDHIDKPIYNPKPKYIKDLIKTYKTNENEIGIDVSTWQGDIDFKKVTDAFNIATLEDNDKMVHLLLPLFKNRENGKGNNCCYYTNVDIFKSKIWIYGHDHKENDYEQDGTRFISNPWGYNTRDYKIKTLTIKK